MIKKQFERTALLLGEDAVEKLNKKHVAVFGVGGVGSYVVESLARSGVGTITVVDKDIVDETNINRQLIALHSTIGKKKVEVAFQRIKDINPDCNIIAKECFFLPETAHNFCFSDYDYVIDAVDNVTAKIQLVESASAANVPIICAMGAGNKLHPEQFEVSTIEKTTMCPLAKVMRKALKERNIHGIKVVYSKEVPAKRCVPVGSVSFVPAIMGLLLSGQVIKELIQ